MEHLNSESIDIYELNAAASDYSSHSMNSSRISMDEELKIPNMKIKKRKKTPANLEYNCKTTTNIQNNESSDELFLLNSEVPLLTDTPEPIMDELPTNENFNNKDQENLEENKMQIARAHWLQIHKVNLNITIIQETFIHLLRHNPHMRPIWQFSRNIDDSYSNWTNELANVLEFKHHCITFQAALTMIMDNLDDSRSLKKLLTKLGAHHFFYDAIEPHFELMHESFIITLKDCLNGTNEELDAESEEGWNLLWEIIKVNMSHGIAIQRQNYLAECMTNTEMQYIQSMWQKVVDRGLFDCGKILAEIALETYEKLLKEYKIFNNSLKISITQHSETFRKFSKEFIMTLEKTINFYKKETGFRSLPMELRQFSNYCIILEVCPYLIRKSIMQGLLGMLSVVLSQENLDETLIHMWSKIYRVLEQAILCNIVDF